jgi:hypothetical protein
MHDEPEKRVLGFLSIDLNEEFFDSLPEEELQAWESGSD